MISRDIINNNSLKFNDEFIDLENDLKDLQSKLYAVEKLNSDIKISL